MKEIVEIDALIIGGGIIGLLTAYEFNLKYPDKFIVIMDKSTYLGDHTTGRNSGVMHAGIYYETGSLKHQLCIQGNAAWPNLAQELDIPYMNCGKYIIACNEEEQQLLSTVKQKAIANKVPKLRDITEEELKSLQETTFAVGGVYSPSTGILDASEAIIKIRDNLYKKNIPIMLSTEAISISKEETKYSIETQNEIIKTDKLYNCAGLDSVKIRTMLGLNELENYYVKGNYLAYNKPIDTKSLIYPIPLKNLKGLGVHLTFDFDNKIKFGPDTEDVKSIDYKLDESRVDVMLPKINKIFKNIDKKNLSVDYAGIRPKILKDKELYKDFWIKGPPDHKLDNYYEACGIESPGLTSAPAIAKLLLEL